MKVDVYWNSHKRCYSVRHKGKVIYHWPFLLMKDVEFVVQPAGYRYFQETGKKVVHAFVRGTLADWQKETARHLRKRGEVVKYNPRRFDRFTTCDQGRWLPVYQSCLAYLASNKIIYVEDWA